MKLYIINITLSGQAQLVQLLFNSEAHGRAAMETIQKAMRWCRMPDDVKSGAESRSLGTIDVADDYGRQLCVDTFEIASALFADYALELNGRQEVGILEAHSQADFQRRAQQDEKLRRASAVIAPPQGLVTPFLKN